MLSALRLVFNTTALLALLALAAVLGIAAVHSRPLPLEQLALGRQIADAGFIPGHESLLFTAPVGTPFDARSWAWDWAAWQTGRLYGPACLRFADALVWLLAVWALAAAAFRRGARPFSTAAFTCWALLAARTDLDPGPGLFAFTTFCAALWIMEGDFWPSFFSRWIWLGPLAVVTVNASPAAWSLAPLGLAWLLFASGREGVPSRPNVAKSAFFVALLICLCLHPQGIASLPRVFASLKGSPLKPGAFEPRQAGLLLGAVSAALLAASSWTPRGRPQAPRDAALLLVFGGATLATRDAFPYFLALAAPLCAFRFDAVVDALPPPIRALRWPAKVLAFLGLLTWVAPICLRGLPRPTVSSAEPAQTVDFFKQELLDANVLCPADWTPGLAWKLAPNARFALDGRGVAERFRVQNLKAALDGRADFSDVLTREGVGLCWLKRGSPLALALASSQGWQPLSFDDASVLYVPVTPANAELIRARAPRGLRPGDPDQPFDATRLVEAEADLEADLARDPSMGVAYLYMAKLWLTRGHEAKARETLEGGIRADPNFAPDYAFLASLRAERGDKADRAAARSLYRRALALDDEDAWRRALAALGPD